MQISDYLQEKAGKVPMKAKSKDDALKELVDLLEGTAQVENKRKLLGVIRERENMGSTGIGQGIAIPHGKSDCIKELCVAVGVSREGVNFDALDGERVHIFFLLAAPDQEAGAHLKVLARVASLLKDRHFRRQLMDSKDAAELLATLKREEKTKF